MSEEMVRKIADGADMIVRGYAFTRADDFIRVFNLNDRESSILFAVTAARSYRSRVH